jgi:hypothetical protein
LTTDTNKYRYHASTRTHIKAKPQPETPTPQVALFESIRPLFTNKQLLVVANKVDVIK